MRGYNLTDIKYYFCDINDSVSKKSVPCNQVLTVTEFVVSRSQCNQSPV